MDCLGEAKDLKNFGLKRQASTRTRRIDNAPVLGRLAYGICPFDEGQINSSILGGTAAPTSRDQTSTDDILNSDDWQTYIL